MAKGHAPPPRAPPRAPYRVRPPSLPIRAMKSKRRRISASTTTGRNTCSSSPPAARSGRSPTGWRWNWPTSTRVRRACGIFDAGIGDGTVLTRVMRATHSRFPTIPLYVVGKEISLEDVRLALEKMPDRFYEHPATVLVITNMYYSEAPWLTPQLGDRGDEPRVARGQPSRLLLARVRGADHRAPAVPRRELARQGGQERQSDLREAGRARASIATTTSSCSTRCGRGGARRRADYDLVIASQPYRARATVEFKA